jgi:hypothetical protein
MLLKHLPDVELKLGLEVKIGDKILGTIIGAGLIEGGMVLVKLRKPTDTQVENPPLRPLEPVNE